MTTSGTELPTPVLAASDDHPRAHDLALLVGLAGASGAALAAQILWSLPLAWTAGLLVLPATALVVLVGFLGRRRYDRMRIVSDRLVAGLAWGVAATVAYDAVRAVLIAALPMDFSPFRANVVFGSLITGRPTSSVLAKVVGWTYHGWNGVGFATMFALVRPRGGWTAGLVWAFALEGVMLALYPTFLEVSPRHPGFLVTSVVGHGVYGLVLGAGLAKWGPR